VHCCLIWIALILRLIDFPLLEDILGAAACIMAWLFLLTYFRAVRLTGPFVVMIGKMFSGDLWKFILLYLVYLIGYTQAFYLLFRKPSDEKNTAYDLFRSLPRSTVTLFVMSFGEIPTNSFDQLLADHTARGLLAYTIFFLYMVSVTILLLNLLIGMMGSTYSDVLERAELEYRGQWACQIVLFEKELTETQRSERRGKNQIWRREAWWLVVEEKSSKVPLTESEALRLVNRTEKEARRESIAASDDHRLQQLQI